MPSSCSGCGAAGSLVIDSGLICCTECGMVCDNELLGPQHQQGLVAERGGLTVTQDGRPLISESGARSRGYQSTDYKAKKKWEGQKRLKDITSSLRLQADAVQEVEAMVSRTTGGEWGLGRWLGVLIGACIYIVARSKRLPLMLVEVGSACDCDVPELGRMLNRVLGLLDTSLAEEEPIIFAEKLLFNSRAFSSISSSREAARSTMEQCKLLLDWAREWCVTTGRHTVPIVAAVVFIVVQANKSCSVGLDEICADLNTQLSTAKKRHKEILEAFLTTVKASVPWLKDLTLADLPRHLKFVLGYLGSTLKLQKKRKRNDEQGPSKSMKTVAEAASVVAPAAFAASSASRQRRMSKVASATERIAKAKRALASASSESSESKSLQPHLDSEDIIVEYLLLQGVNVQQIEQGYYDSILASLKSDTDTISDEEIAKYLRTNQSLVELIEQIKAQDLAPSA